MKAKLDDKTRDTIANLIDKGIYANDIAEIFKCSTSTISYQKQFMELAKSKNIERLLHLGINQQPLLKWTAKKYNLNLKLQQLVEKPQKSNDETLIDLLVEFIKTAKETNEMLKKLL